MAPKKQPGEQTAAISCTPDYLKKSGDYCMGFSEKHQRL